MPLYLASFGLGDDTPFLRAPATGARAFIVLNALDQFGGSRTGDLPAETAGLAALGWDARELDLRDYRDRTEDLRGVLAAAGLVWVVGGNTFVLARAMAMSGFGGLLRDRLTDPTFVYAGYSAGAVVTGPDLDGIELVDDPTAVAERIPDGTVASALGLVPFRVVPHYRSDHPESPAIERVAEHMQARGLEHRCLRDGEALWVDGGSVTLLGGPSVQ